jgi:hypothetical protein
VKTRILVEVTDNLLLEAIKRYQDVKEGGASERIAIEEGAFVIEQTLNREYREQRGQVVSSFMETLKLLHSQKDTAKV